MKTERSTNKTSFSKSEFVDSCFSYPRSRSARFSESVRHLHGVFTVYEGSPDLTRGYSDILDMQEVGSSADCAVLGEESVPNAAMLLAPLKYW